jgi:chemotaxis protein methyltransferase CheR
MEKISDEEFKLLRDLITRKCGIYYNEKQKYIFQQKLLKRLEKNNLKTFKEYYYLLKYNCTDEELQKLYNVLAVNETYFFRENEHLIALKEQVLPEMFKTRPNRLIKILSAGCSSGEEPFSISMVINEALKGDISNISILGLDISQKALDMAQSGIYRKISLTFRSMENEYLSKYFEPFEDNYRLKDSIKNSVRFKQANLFDFSSFATQEKYDIIFCRNVMIYFNKKFKKELVLQFHKMLNPGGYLILSNTENLNEIDSKFELLKLGNIFMYRKNLK